MQLSNSRGAPVDPVPFLVVSLTGVLACFTCGPPYLLAAGVAFGPGVVATTAVAVLLTWESYYEFVWTATDTQSVGRPAGPRLQRIGYAAAITVTVGVGLLVTVL